MRYRVLPYKQGSKSAKALATALGGKVLKLQGSSWVAHADDKVINWGNSNSETFHWPCRMYNGMKVSDVSNKLNFFKLIEGEDYAPKFWVDKAEIPDDAYPVVCRTILNGHSGSGISIADDMAGIVSAPLYVQYLKKKEEYRVHCGRTLQGVVVISSQRKARRLSVPDDEVNWKVRNLAGGFVYVRHGFTVPTKVQEAALKAFEKTGLDFGAVDVIWNENNQKAYVLEVNTAPGLEGTTVEDYKKFFMEN